METGNHKIASATSQTTFLTTQTIPGRTPCWVRNRSVRLRFSTPKTLTPATMLTIRFRRTANRVGISPSSIGVADHQQHG